MKKIDGFFYVVEEIYEPHNGEKDKLKEVDNSFKEIDKVKYQLKAIQVEREGEWIGHFIFRVLPGEPFYRHELISDVKRRCVSKADFEIFKTNLREISAQSFSDGTVFFYYYDDKKEMLPED